MSSTLSSTLASDPILTRVRRSLRTLYGARLERAVLYGSQARGDAGPESDYDIAVFLHDLTDRWAEMDRLADLGTDLLYDTGAVVHAMAFPAGAWQARTPLMGEIRRDGIEL